MSLADAIAEAVAEADTPPPNESNTCDWVIIPLLRAAGYARREIHSRIADNNGQFPDYTLLPDTPFTWYLEAKDWNANLEDRHAQQSLNYANQNGRRWVVLTNGRSWRLYDNDIRGTAAQKHVTGADLFNTDRMERFLQAVSRDSVVRGGLQHFAVRSRLQQVVEEQLDDENSEVIRAVWTALRRRPGLEALSRRDVLDHLRQAMAPRDALPEGEVSGPSSPEPQPPPEEPTYLLKSLETLAATGREFTTNKPPVEVQLPDGSRVSVATWREVAVAVINWLGHQSRLPSLPFTGQQGGNRYFLNSTPDHPDRPMRDRVRFSFNGCELYMDASRSARDLAGRLAALCHAVDVSPEQVMVHIALRDRWLRLSDEAA